MTIELAREKPARLEPAWWPEVKDTFAKLGWALRGGRILASLLFFFGFFYVVKLRREQKINPVQDDDLSPFLYTLR